MAANHTNYVIAGGSAAGMAAACAIRKKDPGGKVTVLSAEADPPYFRPMIPFLISGRKKASDMTLIGHGPYQNADIELRLNARVNRIDVRGKKVVVGREDDIFYDKLLIATGSRPNIPPEIGGTDADGVFALRTLADAGAADQRAAGTRHVVMLGGGLLNLKAAFALLERGIEVTLIVRSPEVLSQLMEPEDAVLIRRALDDAGLKIKTGVSALKVISSSHGVKGVALDNGSEIGCQMVCIGKGVRPNIEFVDPHHIKVDGGVVTDRHTACSARDVFAAGDVAVTYDPISGDRIVTGLWTNAVEMGRCAGANMAGFATVYTGTFGILNATQVAKMPFVSMGIVHTRGTDHEVHAADTAGAFRKLVFSPDGNRLVGVVMVGDISKAGLYRLVIREGMAVEKFKKEIIRHSLHYGHFMGIR